MSYTLRVDLAYANLDDVVSTIANYSEQYAYVCEGNPPNRHVHMWLMSKSDNQTVRKAIKKIVSGKGNAVYSLKQCYQTDDDIDGYPIACLAYFCKEGLCKFVNVPERIEKAAKEYQLAFVQKMRDKSKLKKSIFVDLEEKFVSRLIKHDNGNYSLKPEYPNKYATTQSVITREYIIDFVLMYVKTEGVMFRKFAVVSWCQTLVIRYQHDGVSHFKHDLLMSV